MSYREKDIKHEAHGGRYWVLDTGKAARNEERPADLRRLFERMGRLFFKAR